LVVVLVLGLLATSLSACSAGTMRITAIFDDTGDLQSRGSVQVADVRVGTISRISLTPDFKARVSMAISKGVHIPKASTALLRTTSLLGEKFIELRPNGDPAKGPYLTDGDHIANTGAAPELEFFAQQAVDVLSAITVNDLSTLVDTGAQAFGGKGPQLKALIANIADISATFASRTGEINRIISSLDGATATLAAGSSDVGGLLANLATTSQVLVDNRQKALTALSELSRLARSQNSILDQYRGDLDRQIKQVDVILNVVASQTGEVNSLLDWLNRFATTVPKAVPGSFAQVYMWVVPKAQDPRAGS
jgi:phospholipid/cholesterol/gamma-HCH transport system substrate-binding protein